MGYHHRASVGTTDQTNKFLKEVVSENGIEVRECLVEQEYARILREHACQREPLALTARQRSRSLLEA